MVKVYAIALALGVLLLVGWIFARSLAVNVPAWQGADPERRLGVRGRRVVAATVGFGIAGMSAEFSPRDIAWPWALLLALVGAVAAVWYAGWIDRSERAEES